MPKQDIAVEVFYDGAWQDITADDDVFADTPITIMRGQGDESAAIRPCSIALRLANDDDRYRTSNPLSPLYGKAGRATPLRVSVGGTVRGIGEIASMQPDQSSDFRQTPRRGKAWVDVEAAGILQRIGQWSSQVEPPISRYFASVSGALGFWPLDDPSGATQLSNLIAGGAAATLHASADLQGADGPAGSSGKVVQITTATTEIRGAFAFSSSVSGWQVTFEVQLDAVPGSATYEPMYAAYLASGLVLLWEINNSNYRIRITDTYWATDTVSVAVAYAGTDVTSWVRYRVKITVSAGTVTLEPAWYAQDAAIITGTSATYAATTIPALRYFLLSAGTYNVGAGYANIFATTDTSVGLTDGDAAASFNGFKGDKTAGRWFRLLYTENGLAYHYIGNFGACSLMGAQRSDTLPNLLKEIGQTEDGLIYDAIDELAPVLLLRNARYNQTPALTLTPEDLPAPPREVVDDLDVHNIVTAAQRDGAQYTVEDSTGPLGTQAAPDGVGQYRQTVDINIADQNDLPQYATWWLRRGTVDLPRFPQVVINVAALDADTITQVEAVDIGSVIQIANLREYTVRLQVIGYTETIGTHSRRIVFTCVPDQQFVVGVYDDTSRRYGLRTCTLTGAAAAGVTSLTLAITDDEAWSTTGVPYDFMISGEQVTVTAMGARTGTGPYAQTATVTRAVNGIAKTLPTGTPVHTATPGRWAL